MIFVRIGNDPPAPFDAYYAPFRKLDRVCWPLGASGETATRAERDATFSLAERNPNVVGFILDDFFHEPVDGNAADPLPDEPRAAADQPNLRASLTPAELRTLANRKVRGGKLPIMVVVYTRQVKPRARAHLAEIAQICLWTWRPADLSALEANFLALEKLAPTKQLFLGCYTYDFNASRPLPVSLMQRQVELGFRWLKAGRIAGLIFLATPNVDVGLEAVEWTRKWIQANGDQPLPVLKGR